MTNESGAQSDFERLLEAAIEDLREAVRGACDVGIPWPERVAAAIEAVLKFAAERPVSARAIAVEAMANGDRPRELRGRLMASFAMTLSAGRLERPGGLDLPALTEQLLVGAVSEAVGRRLLGGEDRSLPALAPELIELTLLPYIGAEEARLWARSHGGLGGDAPSAA